MVVPFGWGAGDLVLSIRTLYQISKAFRDVGGSEAHYLLSAAWLESFTHDLERVKEFLMKNPASPCVQGIQEKMLLISCSYDKFESYIIKYDILGPSSSSNPPNRARNVVLRAKKGSRAIKWALKELNGHVDSLRSAVSLPLAEMNLVLLVHLAGQFQLFLAQTTGLPQFTDILDLRTMIQEQSDTLKGLEDQVYQVKQSVHFHIGITRLENDLERRADKAFCRAFERLAQVGRHLDISSNRFHEQDVHNTAAAIKAESARIHYSREQSIENVIQDYVYIRHEIKKRLDDVNKNLVILAERLVGLVATQNDNILITQNAQQVCSELIPQFSEGLEGLQNEMEDTRRQVEKVNGRAILQTGASFAAATTGIACLLVTVFQDQSPAPKTRAKANDLVNLSQARQISSCVESQEVDCLERTWNILKARNEAAKPVNAHQTPKSRSNPITEQKTSAEPSKIAPEPEILEERWLTIAEASTAPRQGRKSDTQLTADGTSEEEVGSVCSSPTSYDKLPLALNPKSASISNEP